MTGSLFQLSLTVPEGAVPVMEAALEGLGGALVISNPNAAGQVPLVLYLTQEPARQALSARILSAAAAAGFAAPELRLETLPVVDWVAESQKGLPAISAGRFYLYGSHVREAPPAGAKALLVDANAAFGTGRHESTRGCLIAMSDLAKAHQFSSVLDMGCGSGVLAMAAARLWPCPVLAVDNDPSAVLVAKANAAANAVARFVTVRQSDGYKTAVVARRGPYGLVLANILAEPLNSMAGDLSRHLAPGGLAVLAGLLSVQEPGVVACHRAQGLRLVRRLRLGDGSTLILRRPFSGPPQATAR